MKKKKGKNLKGFTLIELLAVIVILAIIALIAVPQVLKILNKSRLSAAEDSVYGIVKSAETYVSNFMLQNNGTLPSVELEFNCNGTSCDLTTTLDSTYNLDGLSTLEFKGNKPKSGKVIISDNGTNINTNDLVINGFVCGYLNGEAICYKKGQYEVKENGSIIYFNPETGEQCSDYVESNSLNENKSGCMKWYVFNDTENSIAYNLLLDHNTTASVAWNTSGSNSSMKEVVESLKSDTSSWVSSLSPRLITVNEIVAITGNTSWTTSSGYFYFDSNSKNQTAISQGASNYAWLFDYTNNCTSNGCNIADISTNGYWTSTPHDAKLDTTWSVAFDGSLRGCYVYVTSYGVRPVITIKKYKIL